MEFDDLDRRILFLILKFLGQKKLLETAHTLERESGIYISLKYLHETVSSGRIDEAENYICSFVDLANIDAEDEDWIDTLFEIRSQMFLEALYRHDLRKAFDILVFGFDEFTEGHKFEGRFTKMAELLRNAKLRNLNSSPQGTRKSKSRENLISRIEDFIELNSVLMEKLEFPKLEKGLRNLISQSLGEHGQQQPSTTAAPSPPKLLSLICSPSEHGQQQPSTTATPSPPKNESVVAISWVQGYPVPITEAQIEPAPARASVTKLNGKMTYLRPVRRRLNAQDYVGQTEMPPPKSSGIVPDDKHELKKSRHSDTSVEVHIDNAHLAKVKARSADVPVNSSTKQRWVDIKKPSQCRSLRLPDSFAAVNISMLAYTNRGTAILALASNAVHKLWRWQKNERNTSEKATASIAPHLWQPSEGLVMTNDTTDSDAEYAAPCFALSENDKFLLSASGGKISMFNLFTFKTVKTFMTPPLVATFLIYCPQDNNTVAIGMDDATIYIYKVKDDEVITKLKGHGNRITSLAFSMALNVLVSAGADSQLCVWSINGWEKRSSKFLRTIGRRIAHPADTRIQFHQNQIHLLAVHETHIALLEAPLLKYYNQWTPREESGRITCATYACDSKLIYVCFEDASVALLNSPTLELRCLIHSTAYLPLNRSSRVYPLVIAAHPSNGWQFAVGLKDGEIYVFEPAEGEAKSVSSPAEKTGSGTCTPAVASAPASSDSLTQE